MIEISPEVKLPALYLLSVWFWLLLEWTGYNVLLQILGSFFVSAIVAWAVMEIESKLEAIGKDVIFRRIAYVGPVVLIAYSLLKFGPKGILMNTLLKNARWMDGFVWFVVMVAAWLAYETIYRGVPLTAGLAINTLIVWGLAGAGFAVLSGYFAARRAEAKASEAASSGKGEETESDAKPVGDRASRRRAEREARKNAR